ncbi:MAG: hypothetical protein HUJ98_00840 [Bacteroidaceae bacterium]|nr:hypothetical protein [Bacteroidaceae bacterium]
MTGTFTITCYGKTKIYKESQRAKMTREFQTAMLACDGSEAERYSNIFQDLIAGEKECIDTERPLTPELEAMLAKIFATA